MSSEEDSACSNAVIPHAHLVPRAWAELLDDMRHAPPTFVADAAAAGLHNFEGQALEKFPELWHIIGTEYRYETTQGGIPIYRRIE